MRRLVSLGRTSSSFYSGAVSEVVRSFGHGNSIGALESRSTVATARLRRKLHGPLPGVRPSDTHNSNMGHVHKQRSVAAMTKRSFSELPERSWRSIMASLTTSLQLELNYNSTNAKGLPCMFRYELHQYLPLLDDLRNTATHEDHVQWLSIVASSGILDKNNNSTSSGSRGEGGSSLTPCPVFTNPIQLTDVRDSVKAIAQFSTNALVFDWVAEGDADVALSRREQAARLELRETFRNAVAKSQWIRLELDRLVAESASRKKQLPGFISSALADSPNHSVLTS